jgi:hypothetical protein
LVREGCKILEESGMGVHAAVSEITAKVNRLVNERLKELLGS